eukprot:TRINITY_DN7123_c1_g1_i1.p1 TRINITY_DN7123_c1_g1~~TRINITY_DN7123_c1_g1_i1.p1  ORF type:complete len:251 (+),score=55.64 TRINITY_DN7123_c1_g1_i1:64-816(+)
MHLDPNPVTLQSPKRKWDSDEKAPKRGKIEIERINSLEQYSQFVSSGVKVIAVTAGWKAKRSNEAEEAVASIAANQKIDWAAIRVDEDDVSGEIQFETNLSKVPSLLVFDEGKLSDTITDFSNNDLLNALNAALAPKIPLISSEEHFHSLCSGDSHTIFDFYADWCKPCNRIKPHLPELQKTFPNTTIFKVNRDDFVELHNKCGVQKIPTFQIYKDGKLLDSLQHSDVNLVRDFIDRTISPADLEFDEDF